MTDIWKNSITTKCEKFISDAKMALAEMLQSANSKLEGDLCMEKCITELHDRTIALISDISISCVRAGCEI